MINHIYKMMCNESPTNPASLLTNKRGSPKTALSALTMAILLLNGGSAFANTVVPPAVPPIENPNGDPEEVADPDLNKGLDAEGLVIKDVAPGVEDKDGVNLKQLKDMVAKVTSKVTSNNDVISVNETDDNGITAYELSLKIAGIEQDAQNIGKVKIEDGVSGDSVATTSDIVAAINNTGFVVEAGDTSSLVTTGSKLKFADANNIDVSLNQAGEISISTKDDVYFENTTVENALIIGSGDKVGNGPGPVVIDSEGLNVGGKAINNLAKISVGTSGGKVTIDDDGIDAGDQKITGVAAGTDDTDAVNVSQLNDLENKVTEQITQIEQTIEDAVESSKEGIESTNGSINITETVDPQTKATTFDLSVNTDNKTIKTNADGQLEVNTVKLNTTDGKLDALQGEDADALVTAGDVADAINNSGFVITSGEEGAKTSKVVKAGDVVDFSGNIEAVVDEATGEVKVDTKDDVSFAGSVSVGVDDPSAGKQAVKINQDGINAGNKLITNVQDAVDATDAVNKRQLDALRDDIQLQTVAGGDGISVVPTVDPVTGSKESKVSVDVDDQTIEIANGKVAAKTAKLVTNQDGSVALDLNGDGAAIDGLMKASDVVNAINESGFTVKTNGSDGQVLSAGKSLNFEGGDNFIMSNNNDGDVTIKLANDVAFNSVTVDGHTYINTNGIDAGNKKITNVKAGTADTDAVNVSQLNQGINKVNNSVSKLENDLSGGIAAVAAIEKAPHIAGKWTYAVGSAYYNGETAFGTELRRTADNGRLSTTAGFATSTGGESMIRLGFTGIID